MSQVKHNKQTDDPTILRTIDEESQSTTVSSSTMTMTGPSSTVAPNGTNEEQPNSPNDTETTRSSRQPTRFLQDRIHLPNFPTPRAATKSPSDTLKAVYGAAKYKAGLRLDTLCVQSFMAGIYIAMAGQLFLSVGGGVLGSALFATGLIAVVLTSGELFTGDALIFVSALLAGQVKPSSVLRNWTVSWCLNFAGCLSWAYVLGYSSDALQDLDKTEYAIAVATKKVGQTWLGTFLKGMGANFMVCVGIWQATCAEEVSGKILALWFPITGFVAMGFDHCIANQFLIPLGMMLGAPKISVSDLFLSLLAATLGNLVGGGIFVGAVYTYVFDSMQSFDAFRGKIRHGWNQRPSMKRWRSSRSSRWGPRETSSSAVVPDNGNDDEYNV